MRVIHITLDDLIKSIDIVEYISQFIDLEQRGDEYWGLSCFKDEKTPSFSVRKTPPRFYDYSSGIGGNVFTFVKHYYNCKAVEAVEILRQYAGAEEITSRPNNKMVLTAVCERFIPNKHTKKASAGVILPDDYMKRYEKRADKLAVWEKEGISTESLNRFEVFYDAFSDRIVYPIKNIEGKIVNVGGRTLDPLWKEKKLRKYCYFYSWGTMNTIYGLSENMAEIKKRKEIIIFEGAKSVLLADTWGIRCCGAILTSHLNQNQMRILIGLGCRVIFALDKDVDVTKDRNINRLKRYVNVEYLSDTQNLLDDKDSPVDKGKETFLKLYNSKKKLRQ